MELWVKDLYERFYSRHWSQEISRLEIFTSIITGKYRVVTKGWRRYGPGIQEFIDGTLD